MFISQKQCPVTHLSVYMEIYYFALVSRYLRKILTIVSLCKHLEWLLIFLGKMKGIVIYPQAFQVAAVLHWLSHASAIVSYSQSSTDEALVITLESNVSVSSVPPQQKGTQVTPWADFHIGTLVFLHLCFGPDALILPLIPSPANTYPTPFR